MLSFALSVIANAYYIHIYVFHVRSFKYCNGEGTLCSILPINSAKFGYSVAVAVPRHQRSSSMNRAKNSCRWCNHFGGIWVQSRHFAPILLERKNFGEGPLGARKKRAHTCHCRGGKAAVLLQDTAFPSMQQHSAALPRCGDFPNTCHRDPSPAFTVSSRFECMHGEEHAVKRSTSQAHVHEHIAQEETHSRFIL